MLADALAEYMQNKLGDQVVEAKVAYGQLTLTVVPEAYFVSARICKDDPRLRFDFFDFMAGVDERDEGLAVVTHLYSVQHRHHINLRAIAAGGRDTPEVPSITGIYRGANWHEREAYDMFGIAFTGHPGLEPRLLTAENFEGWPLRKEFLLTTREAKPWPGAKEPEEAPKPGDEATGDATGAETKEAEPVDRAAAAKAKAERAKKKAAEMRAKKARERAAAQAAEEGGGQDERAAAQAAEEGGGQDERAAAQAAEGGGGPDDRTAAAEETPEATPEGAAEEAQSAVAEDAAAGTVGGDVAAGATQDEPGADKAVPDPAHEEQVGEGADPVPGGTPGEEPEGRRAGAGDTDDDDEPEADTS